MPNMEDELREELEDVVRSSGKLCSIEQQQKAVREFIEEEKEQGLIPPNA